MKELIIDSGQLNRNIGIIKARAQVPIIAVLKSNAYGMDLIKLASVLQRHDIKQFAVTDPCDALILRHNGFLDEDIIILRSTTIEHDINTILSADATATIGSPESAIILNRVAKEQGKTCNVHIKIDSGMGRYGFLPNEIDSIVNIYKKYDNLNPTGLYTHLHSSFLKDESVDLQLEDFKQVIIKLKNLDIDYGQTHAYNSSAIFSNDKTSLDAVRIGSAFTGRIALKGETGLSPVCTLKSEIIETKWLPRGHTIGYGCCYTTNKLTKIALVPVGYSDGLCIAKANDTYRFIDCLRYVYNDIKKFLQKFYLYAIVNQKQARVLGHIGLCHTVLDITNIDAKSGDMVYFDVSPLLISKEIRRVYE